MRETPLTVPGGLWFADGDPSEVCHDDPDEAVLTYLDGIGDVADMPKVVVLREYGLVPFPWETGEDFVDWLLDLTTDRLDCDDHDVAEMAQRRGSGARIEKAAETFLAVFRENYVITACRRTGRTEEVDSAEWIAENAPSWLEESNG